MKKQSAGLLVYRTKNQHIEVLLVHSGGPFWAKKDRGAWSIPKGEFDDAEEAAAAARREFTEELGMDAPDGEHFVLEPVKQPSGKIVHTWAIAADIDIAHFKSNTFDLEWPPKSGKIQQFPEADKARWFTLPAARIKLLKGQVPILEQLATMLGKSFSDGPQELSSGEYEDTAQTSLF